MPSKLLQQFGGKITPQDKARYERSPNWKDGQFQNLEPTSLNTSLFKLPSIIYKQLTQKEGKEPTQPLPILPFDKAAFLAPNDQATFIWYGHSAVLLRIDRKTILIDPMLGSNTTPIAPMPTKRFSENTLALIDDFPEIDLILLTHDHYDHLDYDSIQKLKPKTKQYLVALGVKRHLVSWGIEEDMITEMDWWNDIRLDNLQITFTPTRHFSGRGVTDRLKSFWGGWAFKTPSENIWFSGDGGYGEHFKTIGQKLGPFDFAFMECGQYNDDWKPIHMFPDEAVQAAQDARAKKAMPVHWAGFSLSYQHTWYEPAESFVKAAKEQEFTYTLPPLGKLFQINDTFLKKWWL